MISKTKEIDMDSIFKAPVWNSPEGENIYKILSKELKRKEDIFNIAAITIVKLLTYLPTPVCNVLILPLAAMPLSINSQSEIVKKIVQARLQGGV
jgi:hypothetical protein